MRNKSAIRPVALICVSLVLVGVVVSLLARPEMFQTHAASPSATPPSKGQPISKEVAEQIAAINREKESRTVAQQKIDSRLLYTIKNSDGRASLEGLPNLQTGVQPDAEGNVEVDIRVEVTSEVIARLEKLGAKIIYQSPELRTVVAAMPLRSIEEFAALPSVHFIQPKEEGGPNSVNPAREMPSLMPGEQDGIKKFLAGSPAVRSDENRRMVGSASTEGDVRHRAILARLLTGSDGTGVKIGVLSDGVASLAARQASGDLPANVTVVGTFPAGTEEGTAMLEIVHDLAPGAQLFFATATGSGSAAFANNIRTLRNVHGCDIIVDDWTYYAETPFQEGQAANVISPTNAGVVIQAVNDVTASGAIFFSSAGNSGNKNDGTSGAWEGDFVNGGPSGAPLPAGLEIHDFGGGALFNTMTAASTAGAGTFFKWSDPLGASSNDYDIYVLNSTGTAIVSAGTNIQNGTQDPQEVVNPPAVGTRLVVAKKAGAQNRFLHINTNRGRLGISTNGVVHGHNSGRNTQTTAATPAGLASPAIFNPNYAVETFSSDGPRRIFYNADSTPITPGNVSSTGGELLAKPDMTAADGVTTTTPGFLTFFGTSAAAPHAAAIAGLIKSEIPSLTAAQITNAMKSTAIDIEGPGWDRDSGAGIVMPIRALNSLGVEGLEYIESERPTAVERNGNGNANIDAGETWDLTLPITNNGLGDATNVSATLSTSANSGITVVPSATRQYPDLPAAVGVGANSIPFSITLPENFPCGEKIQLLLTVSLTRENGSRAQRLTPFEILSGGPTVISTTLDATPPANGNGYTALTGANQTGRLNRNSVISSCSTPFPKPTPPLQDSLTGRRFDQYTFTASTSGCVNVTLNAPTGTLLYTAAYNGTFDPLNIRNNYLADYGSSVNGSLTYAFNVTAGQQYVVVVHELNVGGGNGVNYTLNIDGPRAGACPAPYWQPGELSGRVVDRAGRGIARVLVTVSDGGSNTRTAMTNTFGNFRFTDMPAGRYTITPKTAKYTFVPSTINLSGNLTGLEIMPPITVVIGP